MDVDAPTSVMVRQAADWIERLQGPEATDADRAAGAQWRAEHPSHELAWQRMAALWGRFGEVADQRLPPGAARVAMEAGHAAHTAARRRTRRITLAIGAPLAVVGAALLAHGLISTSIGAHWRADPRTATGERRVVTLPDRSTITLGGGSSIDIRYSEAERRIVLRGGELLADVAADAARPFIVETPQGTARALGTRYLVRRDADSTVITVLESRVRACTPAAPLTVSDCAEMSPGKQVRLTGRGIEDVHRVDADAEAAWAAGRVSADDRPLVEVLDAIARNRRGLLRYDAAQLDGLRVSGVFSLDDTDSALAALQRTLPLQVDRYTPWIVVVRRR